MKDAKVTAAINMYAVLRSLENLVEMDDRAKKLIANKDITVRFSVPDLPHFYLCFEQGALHAKTGQDIKSHINLKFTSVDHFNKMIDGKANPIPTKGFTKLGFLKNEFTQLTEILQEYLIPDETRLQEDDAFAQKSTILTAYVALFAAVQVANYDRLMHEIASHTPQGKILIAVKDSIAVTVHVTDAGFEARIERANDALARMEFISVEVLGGILRGQLDTYACMGRGQVAIFGKIPMIDNFNKILGSVSRYL